MQPINVGIIGCGGFVRYMHLPNLRADARFRLCALMDIDPAATQAVASEVAGAYTTDDVDAVLADPEIELAFIATPHYNHADLTVRAARAGKHIFCEKPMGLNEAECDAVAAAVRQAGVKYIIGYNRSLAPFTQQARTLLASLHAPMLIYHRFADWNPYGRDWLLDESLSGGRVVGEGGHSLDMMCTLTGQSPIRLHAEGGNFAAPSPTQAPDSAIIVLGFPDGSAGTLYLSSVGNNAFPKEEVQITCANHTIVIRAFQQMDIYAPEGHQTFAYPALERGHKQVLDVIAGALRHDAPIPNGLEAGLRASRATFAAVRAIRTRQLQTL